MACRVPSDSLVTSTLWAVSRAGHRASACCMWRAIFKVLVPQWSTSAHSRKGATVNLQSTSKGMTPLAHTIIGGHIRRVGWDPSVSLTSFSRFSYLTALGHPRGTHNKACIDSVVHRRGCPHALITTPTPSLTCPKGSAPFLRRSLPLSSRALSFSSFSIGSSLSMACGSTTTPAMAHGKCLFELRAGERRACGLGVGAL